MILRIKKIFFGFGGNVWSTPTINKRSQKNIGYWREPKIQFRVGGNIQMKQFLPVIVSAAFMISSCTVTREYATIRTQDILRSEIIQIPKVVKLDVAKDRVSATVEKKQKKGKVASLRNTVEQLALMDAIQKSGSDVLVEPTYKTTQIISLRKEKVTTTVTGFPAKYSEMRDLVPADSSLIKTIKMIH